MLGGSHHTGGALGGTGRCWEMLGGHWEVERGVPVILGGTGGKWEALGGHWGVPIMLGGH